LRDTWKNFVRAIVTTAAVAVAPIVAASPAYAYGVPIDLGTLSGGDSRAWAINLNEEIVGNSDGMPVIWLHRRISALPLPPGYVGGSARDINANGQAVGYVWNSSGVTRAVRWNGTAFAALLEQSAVGGSAAFGINDSGTITGWVNVGFGSDPALFTSSGAQRVTPVNGNGTGYTVSQQRTVVVGNYQVNGVQQPFENGITPPAAGGYMTLPSVGCCSRGGAAWAVNDDGSRIFGNSTTSTGATHPTMWTLGTTSTGRPTWTAADLGMPGGGNGYLNDTNQWGTISPGGGTNSQGAAVAFYWQSGLGVRTLADLGGPCGTRSANAVNGVAEIVGVGCTAGGQTHALLWT
jgi:hypothetical protein